MHPVTLAAFLALGLLEPTPGLGKFIFDAAHFQNLPPVDSQNLEPRYLTNEGVQLSLKERDSICDVEPYDPQPITDQTFPAFDQNVANVYRYRQQQAVNLGSWFVHENWMTPSVFDCGAGKKLSEIDIATGWGSTTSARAVLERHWDTFIMVSDFEYLASIGINTVRLPIGYWSLGPGFLAGTPFANVADVYQNSWSRVIRAVNWAGHYGIGVLIDLHGAPGSQNGEPHSGVSDHQINLFNNPDNVDKTINVLTFLAQTFASVTNVVGLELLNEPQYNFVLEDFYTRAIAAIRSTSSASEFLPIYVHDGFDLERFSAFVSKRSDFVIQDHHSYFVFTPSDIEEPASQHTNDVTHGIASSLANVSSGQRCNLVVHEWSCALTDQSLAGESNKDKARKDFCAAQMKVYQGTTAGWAFWSYTKEECDPSWCFKAAVGSTLPSTFFLYGQTSKSIAGRSTAEVTDINTLSDILSPTTDLNIDHDRYYGLARRRFAAIHARDNWGDMTDAERSSSQGYDDGFRTAEFFASHNMSKLGFTGQYAADSVKALGPIITPSTVGNYTDGFMHGLQDGEAAAASAYN